MIAVIGGLGAAVCWAATTLCASRSTKLIGGPSALAWVMLVGFVVAAPLTAASGIPDSLGARELGWLAVAGAGNVGGLLLSYGALRIGKVSIVAPIISTEGAVAAVLAILGGETLGAAVGAMLGVVVLGVVLASVGPGGGSGDPLRATTSYRVTTPIYVEIAPEAPRIEPQVPHFGGRALPLGRAMLRVIRIDERRDVSSQRFAKARQESGFTLIELLIVLVILGS